MMSEYEIYGNSSDVFNCMLNNQNFVHRMRHRKCLEIIVSKTLKLVASKYIALQM